MMSWKTEPPSCGVTGCFGSETDNEDPSAVISLEPAPSSLTPQGSQLLQESMLTT